MLANPFEKQNIDPRSQRDDVTHSDTDENHGNFNVLLNFWVDVCMRCGSGDETYITTERLPSSGAGLAEDQVRNAKCGAFVPTAQTKPAINLNRNSKALSCGR